jgi:hypothetical protein
MSRSPYRVFPTLALAACAFCLVSYASAQVSRYDFAERSAYAPQIRETNESTIPLAFSSQFKVPTTPPKRLPLGVGVVVLAPPSAESLKSLDEHNATTNGNMAFAVGVERTLSNDEVSKIEAVLSSNGAGDRCAFRLKTGSTAASRFKVNFNNMIDDAAQISFTDRLATYSYNGAMIKQSWGKAGGFWSAVLSGEDVYVEIYTPGSTCGATPPFEFEAISQFVIDPASSADRRTPAMKAAAAICHSDVICYAGADQASQVTARGVARMIYQKDARLP